MLVPFSLWSLETSGSVSWSSEDSSSVSDLSLLDSCPVSLARELHSFSLHLHLNPLGASAHSTDGKIHAMWSQKQRDQPGTLTCPLVDAMLPV